MRRCSGFASASERLQKNRIGFPSASAKRRAVSQRKLRDAQNPRVIQIIIEGDPDHHDPDHHSDEPTLSDTANLVGERQR